MSSGKQTPAPKESSEKKSPAERATGEKSKKEQYPKPSQKN
ncbi:hypothetical protein [Flavobacterium sp. J372]|nr:hypothetical protein [Flavobacterium sp. J372]